MGVHPYWYTVPYDPDIDAALQELRQREFVAGRYYPVMPFLQFPVGPGAPAPGARHASIADALEDAAEDGTRSILDLDHVADAADFCAVAPLPDQTLLDLFGTTTPTRVMVEQDMTFFEDIERGRGVYIVLYRDGRPDELFFAGYSFD